MSPVTAPTRVRALRPASVLVLLLCLVALLPSAPASADVRRAAGSCDVAISDRAAVASAANDVGAVFAAKVLRVRKAPVTPSAARPVQWVHRVRIIETFRGSSIPGARVDVTFRPVKRRPGASLKDGSTYLFFADQSGSGFAIARCGGTIPLAHGLTAALSDRLESDLHQADKGVDVQLERPQGTVRDLPQLSRLVAPGAGLVLIGLLGLVLVGRLARERP